MCRRYAMGGHVNVPDKPSEKVHDVQSKNSSAIKLPWLRAAPALWAARSRWLSSQRGRRVIVTYRQPDEFDALLSDASRARLAAPTGVSVDTTDVAAVAGVVQKIAAEYGHAGYSRQCRWRLRRRQKYLGRRSGGTTSG